MGLSKYEREREARIQRNKELLAALDIQGLSGSIFEQEKKVVPKVRRVHQPVGPLLKIERSIIS